MSDYLHYWSPAEVESNVSEEWCLTLLTCSSCARFTNIGTKSDFRYSTWTGDQVFKLFEPINKKKHRQEHNKKTFTSTATFLDIWVAVFVGVCVFVFVDVFVGVYLNRLGKLSELPTCSPGDKWWVQGQIRNWINKCANVPSNHRSVILAEVPEENPQFRLHCGRDPAIMTLMAVQRFDSNILVWYLAPLGIWGCKSFELVGSPWVAAGKEAASRSPWCEPISATQP